MNENELNNFAEEPFKKQKKTLIAAIASATGVLVIAAVILVVVLTSSRGDNADNDPYRDGEYIDVATGNYYSGIVEPQETVKVEKDPALKVDKIYVEVGDNVKKGDKLFSYDSAQAKLDLDLAKLEYEGINNEIDSYTDQITELTKQRAEAEDDQKLDYTLQIQQAEINKSRAQMNLKSKKVEVENLEKKVKTGAVTAPISGVIKSINEQTDNDEDINVNTQDSSFITILTADSYRVKCTIDELNIGNIYEGMAVTVHSRADETISWDGTISKIDYESYSTAAGNSDYYAADYGQHDGVTGYTFYVTLDNARDILLGQHVFVEIDGLPAAQENIESDAEPDDIAEQSHNAVKG